MKIDKMTDQQCMEKFIALLEKRVSITTGFTQGNDSGLLTHQYITVTCGDQQMISQPEPLDVPLMIAPATETGQAVN